MQKFYPIADIIVWIRQKQKISHRKPSFDLWKILHLISILGKCNLTEYMTKRTF